MRNATQTIALLASHGIVTKKVNGKWILDRMGEQLDAPQRTKRDALSVGVAYALGYMN